MPDQIGERRVESVVIGGSQAGLAMGYHLADLGMDHVILDENPRVGDAWRNRWDSLRAFTPRRYDSLPGMAFPGPTGSYPSKDEIADYLETYASRFDLPIRAGVKVDRLSADGNGFEVVAGDERFHTANVVVATGSSHDPRTPAFAGALDEGIVQLHSSEYKRPSQLADGGVLVVGAGNSGAEIALDVSDEHQVWLSGRDPGQEPTRAGTVPDRLLTPFIWLMAHHVLSVKTPMGRKARDHFMHPPRGIPLGRVRRKDIITAGIERVPRTVDAKDGAPELADGRVLRVANVIWSTGFAPGLSWIDLPIFDEWGWPVHDRGVVDSHPGIYFMGLLFQYTLSSALIGGVGRDAAYIARHLAGKRPVPTI